MSISSSYSVTIPSPSPDEETPLLFSQITDFSAELPNEERPVDDSSDEPSTAHLLKVTSGAFIGMFLSALDSSMMATLSTPIAETLGSLSHLSWLASSYFIATAVTQPLAGKLTDIYGRRAGLVLSNIFFALGNLMCTLAKSEWVLIAGRAVAGVGGGGLMAIAAMVVSDLVPVRRRGVWQGTGSLFFGVGSSLGGFYGGWINDTIGWRNAFATQIPITILSTIWVWFTVKIPTTNLAGKSKFRRIDFGGAITIFVFLTLLLIGVNSGGTIVPWTSPLVLVSIPLSIVSLLAFIYIERNYAEEPIIPLHLLWDRSVAGACLTNGFMCMSRFAMLFYMPIFLQVQGYSPMQTGLRLVPGAIALAITSMAGGIIARWTGRYYKLGIASQIIYLAGVSTISTFDLNTPAWAPFVFFAMTSTGFGAMLTTTLLAVLASAKQKDQAVVTSALYAFRSCGTVLGISLAGLVFQTKLRSELWKRLGGVDNAAEIIKHVIDNLKAIDDLPAGLGDEALQAYMAGLRAVFITLVMLGSISTVCSAFIKDRELSDKME